MALNTKRAYRGAAERAEKQASISDPQFLRLGGDGGLLQSNGS